MKLIVSGATGYIGGAFCDFAAQNGAQILALVRQKPEPGFAHRFLIPHPADDLTILTKAMEGADAVVHCAGLAHGVTPNKEADIASDMTRVNGELPERFARAAHQARVKRFILISSAAIFGSSGHFNLHSTPAPHSSYGQSKLAGEDNCKAALGQYSPSTTALSIIRPPMVIGPGAPGHPAMLRRLVTKHIPLPFGALDAPRSSIHINRLTAAIWRESTELSSDSFLTHAADAPLPVRELIKDILAQDELKPIMLPVPAIFFEAAAMIVPSWRDKITSLTRPHILEAGRQRLVQLL